MWCGYGLSSCAAVQWITAARRRRDGHDASFSRIVPTTLNAAVHEIMYNCFTGFLVGPRASAAGTKNVHIYIVYTANNNEIITTQYTRTYTKCKYDNNISRDDSIIFVYTAFIMIICRRRVCIHIGNVCRSTTDRVFGSAPYT